MHKQGGEIVSFETVEQHRERRRPEGIRAGEKHILRAVAILGQGNLD